MFLEFIPGALCVQVGAEIGKYARPEIGQDAARLILVTFPIQLVVGQPVPGRAVWVVGVVDSDIL